MNLKSKIVAGVMTVAALFAKVEAKMAHFFNVDGSKNTESVVGSKVVSDVRSDFSESLDSTKYRHAVDFLKNKIMNHSHENPVEYGDYKMLAQLMLDLKVNPKEVDDFERDYNKKFKLGVDLNTSHLDVRHWMAVYSGLVTSFNSVELQKEKDEVQEKIKQLLLSLPALSEKIYVADGSDFGSKTDSIEIYDNNDLPYTISRFGVGHVTDEVVALEDSIKEEPLNVISNVEAGEEVAPAQTKEEPANEVTPEEPQKDTVEVNVPKETKVNAVEVTVPKETEIEPSKGGISEELKVEPKNQEESSKVVASDQPKVVSVIDTILEEPKFEPVEATVPVGPQKESPKEGTSKQPKVEPINQVEPAKGIPPVVNTSEEASIYNVEFNKLDGGVQTILRKNVLNKFPSYGGSWDKARDLLADPSSAKVSLENFKKAVSMVLKIDLSKDPDWLTTARNFVNEQIAKGEKERAEKDRESALSTALTLLDKVEKSTINLATGDKSERNRAISNFVDHARQYPLEVTPEKLGLNDEKLKVLKKEFSLTYNRGVWSSK